MQKGGYSSHGSLNRPKLFIIVTVAVFSIITIPLIIPHITHPSMIYHILLHVAGVIISVFLTIVSYLAYKRNNSIKILLMTLAFSSLGVVELLYLLYATNLLSSVDVPMVNIELPHLLLLAMLTLFGTGVLKVNQQ